MKANILDLEGKKSKQIDLPIQFDEEYRPDIIKRAVLSILNNKKQPYGAKPYAGQRSSAVLSRRRRDYKGSYGHGISRVPRKSLWKRGRQFGWVGAFAPGTVGGRKAHPPKADKNLTKKINVKERRKAIRSAIAATANTELVKARGHIFNINLPIIFDSKLENVNKTKELKSILTNVGLKEELVRTSKKKVRAGKGKVRGRRYTKRRGMLLVVSKSCPLIRSATNIPGIDIAIVDSINVELLAPGTIPGRLTIFTEDSIKKMKDDNLFLGIKKQEEKTKTKK